MNVLLDTHILLWWLDDNSALNVAARDIIADGENTVFISTVSLWEISIKQALGKLEVPRNFREVVDNEPMQYLTVKPEHAFEIINLPMHHRDPFDRMLISQAKQEKLTLITHDQYFSAYGIKLFINT